MSADLEMLAKRQPLYELTIDGPPPHKILPFGMDESDLIDATPVGAMYRVFINQRTGEILDGGKFARYAEEAHAAYLLAKRTLHETCTI